MSLTEAESMIAASKKTDREIDALEAAFKTRRRRLLRERRRLWLRANRAGLTYTEIQRLTGYSDALICREIQRAVREAGASAGRLRRNGSHRLSPH